MRNGTLCECVIKNVWLAVQCMMGLQDGSRWCSLPLPQVNAVRLSSASLATSDEPEIEDKVAQTVKQNHRMSIYIKTEIWNKMLIKCLSTLTIPILFHHGIKKLKWTFILQFWFFSSQNNKMLICNCEFITCYSKDINFQFWAKSLNCSTLSQIYYPVVKISFHFFIPKKLYALMPYNTETCIGNVYACICFTLHNSSLKAMRCLRFSRKSSCVVIIFLCVLCFH